ncbi:MAG: hypothetical protein ACTHKE_04290 [Sphingomicrobium sp.]
MSLVPCTTPDCENQTATYLCHRCVADLQAWIDKVPDLLPELDVTIARLDRVTKQQGGGGSKPGSKAPVNLDAVQMKINLQMVAGWAGYYETDEHAAGIAKTIRDWVTNAEIMISGPEEQFIDHAGNRERVRNIAPAMPTRKLVPWLKEKAGIVVTSMDIRNWARRGKLHPAAIHPQPTYHPHEVLNAWRETHRDHV